MPFTRRQKYTIHTHTHTRTQQKIKSNQRRKANKERKFCAELLAGHRKRSGLIKPSLCTPVSLNIRMLRTSTLFTLYAAQSESVLCQGKERERNRKGQRREGGRGILQVAGTNSSQDDTGVAHLTSLLRLSLLYENIHEKWSYLSWKINGFQHSFLTSEKVDQSLFLSLLVARKVKYGKMKIFQFSATIFI